MTFDYDCKFSCEQCGRRLEVAIDYIAECDLCGARYRVEIEQTREGDCDG